MMGAANARTGSALLVVLLVVASLGYGVYAFSEKMLLEYEGTRRLSEQIRASETCYSAVTLVASRRPEKADFEYEKPISWNAPTGETYTALLYAGSPRSTWAQFPGPLNECGKLNLNSLALDLEQALVSRKRLLALGMSSVMADSLLDWLDEDDLPREFGAEDDWYLASNRNYTPRQGRIPRLTELLLIRGFTPDVLFGADENANGWIDRHEQQNASLRIKREQPAFGLSEWITVLSAESNVSTTGQPKINLNSADLVELYRLVEKRLGSEAARFVVALRMNGPANARGAFDFDSPEAIAARKALARSRAQEQVGQTLEFERFQGQSFGGFSVDRPGRYELRSVVDLVAVQVEATVDGQSTVLQSPWKPNGQLSGVLKTLEDQFTLTEDRVRIGRINPLVAIKEVLVTVPGLSDQLCQKILRSRPETSECCRHQNIGWLVDQRLLTLPQLRVVAPYLTGGGDVYSGVSWGGGENLSYAVSFLVDHSLPDGPIVQYEPRGVTPWPGD